MDAVDEELLIAMKKHGCHQIMYGIESASTAILKNIGKRAALAKAEEAVRITKKVGIDIWDLNMEAAIRETFPDTEFVDGYQSVLMRAKEIKTHDEILALKIANAMTEAALDKALEFLRPGVRECEVLAVAWHTMTAMGSEWTQCSNIVASGPYTAPYRRFTSDRIIRNGDPVIIDIGASFNGYYGDLTRTWICGNVKPTEEMKRIHQNCYDALFNAASVIKPGATNAEVFAQADPYVLDSLGHGATAG